ncbi:MAG: YggS family pyridoxal phosphate-dependent enzyme [Clostridiales bacterium]|nr:YggS family pyridoxal phosphate-dependent enzyme [Clostridiales bacterium]
MNHEELSANVRMWQERVGNASAKWGGAEICGVSKTIAPDIINMAWDAGIRTLGENRVQEVLAKIDQLDPRFDIHLIGQLQTNKVKPIIDKVAMIQSLDRDSLALEISRRAEAIGRRMPVLVQVNIGREVQKSGVDEEELLSFIKRSADLPGIKIEGLMAIMPIADDPESIRPLFRRMREWFERLRDADIPGVDMHVLSMGMSDDCIVAAEEGSTMVRLGRALFGARPPKI